MVGGTGKSRPECVAKKLLYGTVLIVRGVRTRCAFQNLLYLKLHERLHFTSHFPPPRNPCTSNGGAYILQFCAGERTFPAESRAAVSCPAREEGIVEKARKPCAGKQWRRGWRRSGRVVVTQAQGQRSAPVPIAHAFCRAAAAFPGL